MRCALSFLSRRPGRRRMIRRSAAATTAAVAWTLRCGLPTARNAAAARAAFWRAKQRQVPSMLQDALSASRAERLHHGDRSGTNMASWTAAMAATSFASTIPQQSRSAACSAARAVEAMAR